MARKAAKQLLKKTGVDPDTIDAVIVSTSTADYAFPSTASIVIGKLGLKTRLLSTSGQLVAVSSIRSM